MSPFRPKAAQKKPCSQGRPTAYFRRSEALASAVVVIAVVVTVSCQVAIVKHPLDHEFLRVTLANQPFMSVLAVGAAWLIVRRASIGWFTVLLTGALIAIAHIKPGDDGFPVYLIGQHVAAAIVGAVILVAGRPRRP